jgi:ribosome-associated toxin RatA of RatAB toxin-antitoxin module
MPVIRRQALVRHPADYMFDLVNDVAAYPRRFGWCERAEVISQDEVHMLARLDLGIGAMHTWFTTENRLQRPGVIEMTLRDGPFKRLLGRWEFKPLDEGRASKVSLSMEFEPSSRLLGPVLAVGLQGLADRMVGDFVRAADQGAA